MGRGCAVHRHREDVPLEVHHIWPLGDGGPNTASNKVTLCSNAHSAVHDLLAKRRKGPVPWPVRRRYGPGVRHLAEDGWRAIVHAQTLAGRGEDQ
jgi:5-methylcytosine-specific restriction endonuclease McrA